MIEKYITKKKSTYIYFAALYILTVTYVVHWFTFYYRRCRSNILKTPDCWRKIVCFRFDKTRGFREGNRSLRVWKKTYKSEHVCLCDFGWCLQWCELHWQFQNGQWLIYEDLHHDKPEESTLFLTYLAQFASLFFFPLTGFVGRSLAVCHRRKVLLLPVHNIQHILNLLPFTIILLQPFLLLSFFAETGFKPSRVCPLASCRNHVTVIEPIIQFPWWKRPDNHSFRYTGTYHPFELNRSPKQHKRKIYWIHKRHSHLLNKFLFEKENAAPNSRVYALKPIRKLAKIFITYTSVIFIMTN